MTSRAIAPGRTIVDVLVPFRGIPYQLAIVFGFSLLIALFAQISIHLPFTPVPVTGQTYAVLLAGAALGSRRGTTAVMLYILEGGLGLPFFAGASAGPAVLLGPTGGYLAGCVAAAYTVGWLAERGWDRTLAKCAVAMVAGEIAIYALGMARLATFVGSDKVVALGLAPFVPGDALKLALAIASLPLAWRLTDTGGNH